MVEREESPKQYPVMLSNSEASLPQRSYLRNFSFCSYFLGRRFFKAKPFRMTCVFGKRFFLPTVVRMTLLSSRTHVRDLTINSFLGRFFTPLHSVQNDNVFCGQNPNVIPSNSEESPEKCPFLLRFFLPHSRQNDNRICKGFFTSLMLRSE